MSNGSINTNTGAYVALQSLNATNSALGSTLVGKTVTSLTSISKPLTSAKALLAKIGDSSISDDRRSQHVTSFESLVSSVANAVGGSTYAGQTLLGSTTGAVVGTGKTVTNNAAGATSAINAEDNSGTAASLAALIGVTFARSTAGVDTFSTVTSSAAQATSVASLAVGAGFDTAQTKLDNQLNQAGADSNYRKAQITFNSSKMDGLNAGLGSLVDADLSHESAVLQSLQIKQQLGTQALSVANQAPQALLSLFK